MADTGKIAVKGFGAGAIKYVTLRGYNTDPADLDNLHTDLLAIDTTLKTIRALLEYIAFKHQ